MFDRLRAAVSFRCTVISRVLLLLALSAGTAWALLTPDLLFARLVLAGLLALATIELIHFLERSYRAITDNLNYIRHHDFGTTLPVSAQAPGYAELALAMRNITDEFRRLNAAKAASLQYLEVVIEHAGVALLCVDDRERIRLFNPRARTLLCTPLLHTLAGVDQIDVTLGQTVRTIHGGERQLVRSTIAGMPRQFVCQATAFELLGERYKLVSLQDIHDELERLEVESWQRLLQVMTHEIMNSLTPIVSLTAVLRDEIGSTADDNAQREPADYRTALRMAADRQPSRDIIERSLAALETRSRRLIEFVHAYASVAQVPAPILTGVDLREVVEHITSTVAPDLARHGIVLTTACDDSPTVRCDRAQIEQVLLNLVRNASEALHGRDDPRIELRVVPDAAGTAMIEVADNGPGIAPEHMEKIFVPFFTTKPKGTGIGLSVSRQIMLLQKGGLSVTSRPGAGATFSVSFDR
ncbi:MAG: hypothetical protein IT494_02455 [Gammaproteobacteria bacterium]|nr:hypothetical protein [Gammaproteobacteria bacterium]